MLDVGTLGERIAARYLESRGAVIDARNVRVGNDEIDLLARIDGARVAVEVKTRRGDAAGDPLESLDARKIRALRRAMSGLQPSPARLDAIGIELRDDGVAVRWVRDVA